MHDQRTYALIGAAMFVHRELGPGYLKVIYQRALAAELRHRGIPFEREAPVDVWYRGGHLGCFRADFLCFGEILVELKALAQLGRTEVSQVAHYLTATGHPLGLLVNFGADALQFQRVLPRRSTIVGPTRRESIELRDASEPFIDLADSGQIV